MPARANSSHRGSRDEARHHEAVVAAELRRIERQLRALGPMPLSRLSRSCGAAYWRDGDVIEAVRQGVRQRRLRQLPFGWIASAR